MSQNQQLPDLSKGVTNKNQLFMHTVSTFSATKCIFSGRHNTPNAGQNTGLGLGEVRVSSSTDNWKEDCPFFSLISAHYLAKQATSVPSFAMPFYVHA